MMEQKFEKTFAEKFGDFYASLWKRALLSLACAVLGFLECMLIGTGVGTILLSQGIFSLCCFSDREKTKYIKSVQVILPDGSKTACALFEQRVYAFVPHFMVFCCVFNYIPYRKQYFLVRNMEAKNLTPGIDVPSDFLSLAFLNIEIIPKSKCSAILSNPQIISDEIYVQAAPRRETFLCALKPFAETGLLKEIYHTDKLSICEIDEEEDIYALFYYENHSDIQCGQFIRKSLIEKLKEDHSRLFEYYITGGEITEAYLTNEMFERILKWKHELSEAGDRPGANTDSEKTADVNEEAAVKHMNEINNNKTVFTNEMIASRLMPQAYTGKLVLGIILLFLALGAFELTVLGITFGLILGSAISLLIGGLLTYFGVKNIKKSKKNRKTLLQGKCKIIKTKCVKCSYEEETDDGENSDGIVYHFSNGSELKPQCAFAAKGDIVYLVYLDDNKKVRLYFNAIEYKPDDRLVIEDCL